MEHFIDKIFKNAASDIKNIVLPETQDIRILHAAAKAKEKRIANIFLIGDIDEINSKGFSFTENEIFDHKNDELLAILSNKLYELRKHKGITLDDAKKLLDDNLYFGTMLVKCGLVDGMVAGACNTTANVLRPALQLIKTSPDIKFVSSFFVIEVPSCQYGQDGLFMFADCGLEVQPDATKLANCAVCTAKSWETIVDTTPYIALLSHSSYGSASNDDSNKVVEAVEIAKDIAPELNLDGELQVDCALDADVAKLKAPRSSVAGRANVLIFPDLDAGNIGYKLVQRLAKANAYGPITQGLAAPINDLSRGCSVDDIVGTIAITALQAREK